MIPLPWLTHSPVAIRATHRSGAVGRELVVVCMESRDAAEVDHGARVLRREAHGTSRQQAVLVGRSPDAPP